MKAIADGEVVLAEPIGTYGLTVIVQHGGGDYSVYGSLANASVRVGATVQQGADGGHRRRHRSGPARSPALRDPSRSRRRRRSAGMAQRQSTVTDASAPSTPPFGFLGAHVSSAGGTAQAPPRAAAIGATAMQLFTKQANRWAERACEDDECRRLPRRARASGVAVDHRARQLPDQPRLARPDAPPAVVGVVRGGAAPLHRARPRPTWCRTPATSWTSGRAASRATPRRSASPCRTCARPPCSCSRPRPARARCSAAPSRSWRS